MTARPVRLEVAEPVAGREFSRTYLGRADQVGHVREFVRGVLPASDMADDAVVAVSELSTNSIRHSRSGQPGGLFTVGVVLRPGYYVRVEVSDDGGRWDVRVCGAERGRGLAIVAALAGEANWGVAGDETARTVWARFGWPCAAVQETSSPAEARTAPGEAAHA
ncbi:MAG: ATP-binding protein [Streptosporangiaceae bacterium]